MKNKKGFTLVEILVCILIIGVLTTISLPVYLRAREKAKAAEALSVLGAVASAEHRHALVHNRYSSDFEKLDINIGDTTQIDDDVLKMKNFEVIISEGISNLKDTAYVLAYRKNAGNDNVIYSLYQCIDNNQTLCLDGDTTDRITCEALGFDGEANPMDPCGGAPVNDARGCGYIGGFWSTASGTCYSTAQERCDAVSGTMNNGICSFMDSDGTTHNKFLDEDMSCQTSFTGSVLATSPERQYAGGCSHTTINEGSECIANGSFGCNYSIINNGGICSSNYQGGCSNSTINEGGVCESVSPNNASCNYSTVNDGGVCYAKPEGYQGCYRAKVNDGGVCRGEAWQYACKEATINSGGICYGAGYHSCRQITVNDGGIFVAKDSTAGYGNTYNGSGCCVDCTGTGYCHNSGHVCNMSAEEKNRYCHMYDEED